MITVGAMRLPQPEPLDDLDAFLRGLQPDGGYWLAMRRLSAHDHSGGIMGVPVAGGGGGGDVPPEYITESELAAALGPYATDADLAAHVMAANPHSVYATDVDLANHAAAVDPHPAYTTATELSTALTAHEGAANPHPVYALDTDLAGYSPTTHTHAALYEPLDSAYTKSESDARYRPIAYVTDVTMAGDNGVGVTESPANTFALATKVSPDSANILVLRANGLYAPAAGTDPALAARVAALEASVAALKPHVHELGTFGAGTLAPTGGIP